MVRQEVGEWRKTNEVFLTQLGLKVHPSNVKFHFLDHIPIKQLMWTLQLKVTAFHRALFLPEYLMNCGPNFPTCSTPTESKCSSPWMAASPKTRGRAWIRNFIKWQSDKSLHWENEPIHILYTPITEVHLWRFCKKKTNLTYIGCKPAHLEDDSQIQPCLDLNLSLLQGNYFRFMARGPDIPEVELI